MRTVLGDPPGQGLSARPPISSGIVRNGFRDSFCAYKVLSRVCQGFVKGLSRICPCKFRKKNFQDKSAQINIRTVPVDPPGQGLSATPPISSGIVRNGFRDTFKTLVGMQG